MNYCALFVAFSTRLHNEFSNKASLRSHCANRMTRLGKKEMERWILDRFLESLGEESPGSSSSFIADESPDFLMGTATPCPLGIEICEINHVHVRGSGLRLRQEEGIQEHLCRTIELRWDIADIPIAEVSLYLHDHQLPKKQEEPVVADAILAVVRAKMPKEECVSEVSGEELWQNPILRRHVYSLSVARWSGLTRPYVTKSKAAFLPPLSHELLQDAFALKNRKVAEYKRRCNTVWLVAAYNNSTLSTHFSPHDSAVSDAYDLSFDRTFVFDVINKEPNEIKAQR